MIPEFIIYNVYVGWLQYNQYGKENDMTDFEKVMMKRDGMTEEEARIARNEASERLYGILNNGGSYDEAEEMLLADYSLEMDYIMDLL